MVSSRLIASTLWTLPLGVVVVLFAWAAVGLVGVLASTLAQGYLLALLSGLTATALGLRYAFGPVRRLGLGLIVGAYFASHLTLLRLDAAASLGFLTLALLSIELRIIADRFVPLYAGTLEPRDRERVGSALQRSLVRVLAVTGAAFLGSTLAADLALAGTIPATTIPTALLLAAALLAVILVLALWPLLERREG